jgi:catechol 2,3-dioxygenase-like lactoylglutathione lyase family enzyme
MILMPIVYVSDMDESVAFYERLGFEVDLESRGEHWTELKAGDGAVLALHAAAEGEAGRVELSMVATEPLERLVEASAPARGISSEAFGRSLVLRDPNGLEIQVNEHDRELHP